MITEDYVSFEVAKLLKEKGFNEPVTELNRLLFNEGEKPVLKITHQKAMKWLRERRIYIMIDRSWSMADSWQYCICVNNDFDNLIQQTSVPNRTYEEAVEAALKYSLENLI